ncbi:MAG: TIR domain-containing protein [Lachnospiraceae bacterium]|nr:TIR domain-containing protein [Lachnospiraceae bacterium]
MERDIKRKIFISHSSQDKEYGQAILELLQAIGLNGHVFFSSDTDTGIPVNEDIFEHLKKQIGEDAYMLFLLSNNFYGSIACLNEMGAAWGGKNACALLIVPGFDIGNEKVNQGALNPRQMAVGMDNKKMIQQLMADILNKCSVDTDNTVVENACRNYIEKIQHIQKKPSIRMQNELWEVEQKLAVDARNPELYTRRGKLLMELGSQNYQKAISDYLYAIFLDSDFFTAYSELIQAAAKRKDYKQAMWFAEEACRRFPGNGNSFGCRAYVKCQKGDYLESIEDCERALMLSENRWFNNTRGRCYLKRGLFWEALVDFWTAHKKDPQYQPAIDNIKMTVEKIGYSKLLEAVKESKKTALANNSKDEHFDKALMYLECLEIFAPSKEEILQEYGGLYYDFRQYDEALTYWKRALEADNSCWNNCLCAAALRNQGKYAQARGYYKIALEFPDSTYRQYAAEQLAKMDEGV